MSHRIALLHLWLLLASAGLAAQTSLNGGGAAIVLPAGGQLTVPGTFTTAGTVVNDGTLSVGENLTQSGASSTFTGTGSLVLSSPGTPLLTTVNGGTVGRLLLPGGGTLTLGGPLTVTDSLDLTAGGSMELNAHDLTLAPLAVIGGADASQYVVTNSTGALRQTVGTTPVVFPVGNGTYNPAQLTNTGTSDAYTVRVADERLAQGNSGAPFVDGSVNRTWFIEEGTPGGSAVTLDLEWSLAEELPGFLRAEAGVTHFFNADWQTPYGFAPAQVVGTDRYRTTASGVSNFSPFSITTQSAVLPVELLDFRAERSDAKAVLLTWATATEIDNDRFVIERMLDGENHFVDVATLAGAGTTTLRREYSAIDENEFTGPSYYRLRQVDFDGSVTFSPVRTVTGVVSATSATLTTYPNPTTSGLTLSFTGVPETATAASISVMDVYGRVLRESTHDLSDRSRVTLTQIDELPPATYVVSVRWGGKVMLRQHFVKL